MLLSIFLEDGVRDVPPDHLGDLLCDSLFDANFREAEDVLPIRFVPCVAVVVDLGVNSAIVGAGSFDGRSRRREHASLLDVQGSFLVVERVANVARQPLHSVVRVFEQMPLEDVLDLC